MRRPWMGLLFLAASAAWLPGVPVRAQQPAATRPMLTVPDLSATLKAPTASQAERDEAARRLVAAHQPAARQALRDALVDLTSRKGQLAVARAMSLDHDPDPSAIDPLFALVNSEPPMNEYAVQALANYRTPEVGARLMDLARDASHQQRDSTRIAAIKALGTFTDKASAQTLVDILSGEGEAQPIRNAAADALAAMTGIRENRRDFARWQQWWSTNAGRNPVAFEEALLQLRARRQVWDDIRYSRMAEETRAILTEAYQAAPERTREALLLRFLRAETPETRAAGVQIVHDEFTQNRPIPASVRAQLRAMVGDSATEVRILVVRALWELNDAAAFDSLLRQLAQEPNEDVRAALVEALVPIQDLAVVPSLIERLQDSSLVVAETAAKGLAKYGKAIREKPELARQTADALKKALDERSAPPAPASFRAALIEAMAPLRNADFRFIYTKLLQPGEPVIVRQAAAQALGELRESWAADILVNSLDDPDEGVRLATLDALKQCAKFDHAERIYEHLKPDGEPSEAVRQRAWDALCAVFAQPEAAPAQLSRWADRFMQDPTRRLIILKYEADKLQKTPERQSELATVQQNIGAELMKLNDPEGAAASLRAALQYYQTRGDSEMIASALTEQLMDAYLAAKQYANAVDLAAQSIAHNQGYQQTMGPRLRNQVDLLRRGGDYDGALSLIELVKKMNPPLADVFVSQIQPIEEDVRRHLAEKNKSSGPDAPTNAIGSIPSPPAQ